MEKELKDGMYVISPISNDYVTRNKQYKARNVMKLSTKQEYVFSITTDLGWENICLSKQCYIIGYRDWIISDTPQVKDIFTQQDLIEFADYVRQNDLRCNARLELDIKHSKDLFDIWVKERLETINFKK